MKLYLAQRALRDIAEIESYSVAKWGKRAAAKYIADLEDAIKRIKDTPDLLRPVADFHSELRFYRANKHLLVCDVQPKGIFLLTIVHASRDIPSHLAEMQPTLAAETELLHDKLRQRKK